MDFFKIIDQLSEVDADVLGRFDSRRSVFSSLGTAAKRSALAATPLFLGALFQKAYAGTTATAVEVLQYGLALELFEQDFYDKVQKSGLYAAASASNKASIDQIKKHEDSHVKLLSDTIKSLNGTPVTGVKFKAATFATLSTFNGAPASSILGVAQLLEDTGVRAYKGRAGELLGTDLLTVALQIHAVEARHAAKIRVMRGQKAWVNPGDDQAANAVYTSGTTPGGMNPARFMLAVPAYAAPSPTENNTTQSGVPITTGLGTPYTAADAAASFDEYLQVAEVLDDSRAGGLIGA